MVLTHSGSRGGGGYGKMSSDTPILQAPSRHKNFTATAPVFILQILSFV